jgi:hypothetical protein
MFRPVVVGPVATVGAVRYRVLGASLEDPADPAVLCLDAADGPLWLTRVERLEG